MSLNFACLTHNSSLKLALEGWKETRVKQIRKAQSLKLWQSL